MKNFCLLFYSKGILCSGILSFVGEELKYQGMIQNFIKMKLHFEMWAMEQMPFLSGKEKAEFQEKEFVGEEFQYYDFFPCRIEL